MMKLEKIFAVSFIAMLAVSAANATVVTQSNIVGDGGIDVSVKTVNSKQRVVVDASTLQDKIGTGEITGVLDLNNEDYATDLVTAVNSMSARLGFGDSYGSKDTLVSHIDNMDEDIRRKQDELDSGSGGNVTITTNNASASGVVKAVTASSGEVSVVRGTIAAGDLASNSVTTVKITDKNVTAPKIADGVVKSGSNNVSVTRNANSEFEISVTGTDISGKVDKTVAGEANKIMVRNSSGTMVPATFATYEDDNKDDQPHVSITNGTVSIDYAVMAGTAANTLRAESATWAERDGDGNFIDTTYVKKAQGSSAQNKAVITDASGNITTGTIASGMITDNTIMNADINDNAAIAGTKINAATSSTRGAVQLAADAQNSTQVNTTAENVSNKVTATSPTSTQKSSTSMYPSMATADAMATAAANTKQAKLSGTEGNVVLYGASAGSTGSMAVHKRDYSGNNATINAENAEIPTVAYARVVATEVAGDYVGIDQGSGNANKVLVTDSSGGVEANLIANKHVATNAAITTNKIGALTNYSKAGTNAALTTSDTLNGALGKLEKQAEDALYKIPSGSENSTTLASIWVE